MQSVSQRKRRLPYARVGGVSGKMSAAVFSGTLRNFRRWSGRIARFRWKRALVCCCILAIAGFFVVNWLYQVYRKPGELLAPVSSSFAKSPESTWRSYGSLFESHSTSIVSPEFLAALAQIEADGNPIARTYWRWKWSSKPSEIYRPASSAVGMYQITDGMFAEARKYCIHDHKVVTDGPWHDPRSCWFNSFYTRTVPSHAVEMTAAYLHQKVENTLAARRVASSRMAQKQRLAAVIHLCGPKRGDTFVKRRFQVVPGERCGTHDLRRYLRRMDLMRERFVLLRTASSS